MPQGVRAAASAGAALVCLLLSQWVGVCAGSATLLGEPLHVTYVVSGAGSASVDGRYIQLDTMTNGAWHFVMVLASHAAVCHMLLSPSLACSSQMGLTQSTKCIARSHSGTHSGCGSSVRLSVTATQGMHAHGWQLWAVVERC